MTHRDPLGAAAPRLVACAYAALDLFAGRADELLEWARSMPAEGAMRGMIPVAFDSASAAALLEALRTAEVTDSSDAVDPVRMLQFRETVELLPHFQSEELLRLPGLKPQVVFTLPDGLKLSEGSEYLSRSLAVRLSEALWSARDVPVLLASPFWSPAGVAILKPALARAVGLGLPITLAGARPPIKRERHDHLSAMSSFGTQLRADGADVTCLMYQPPFPTSLFHAKLACGRVGYLGSGNFTNHALGKHVEAGVPLHPVDVVRVWWLIQTLREANLLVEFS